MYTREMIIIMICFEIFLCAIFFYYIRIVYVLTKKALLTTYVHANSFIPGAKKKNC